MCIFCSTFQLPLEGMIESFSCTIKFIANQQAACSKSVVPYDYPPHVANSSWWFDPCQTSAHFKTILKCKANNLLLCGLASKHLQKSTIQNKHTQDRYALQDKRNCFYYGTIDQ